jgi:hypothetical protein
MPAFASKPLNKSPLYRRLKKHPALFGVPFLLVMVGASFGLQTFTQTRYDLHSQKVTQVRGAPTFLSPFPPFALALFFLHYPKGHTCFFSILSYLNPANPADITLCKRYNFFQMSREQELGLDRNRKKFDVREEYFVSFYLPWLRSLFFWGCVWEGWNRAPDRTRV